MKRYPPVPQMAPKTRLIDGVSIRGYEDGDTYYLDFIASDGGAQKALEKLRKKFKKIIVLDPIGQARGFWDKMIDRDVVDLLVHSIDFDDGRGEVMVPDDEIESLAEATETKLPMRQAVDAYLKQSGLDADDVESCFGTCKYHAYKLAQTLRKHGHNADVIQVVGPAKKLFDKELHPQWVQFLTMSDKARNHIVHYVVQTGNKIVDITGRQFGKKGGGVQIVPKKDFLANWDSHEELDRKGLIESAIVTAIR